MVALLLEGFHSMTAQNSAWGRGGSSGGIQDTWFAEHSGQFRRNRGGRSSRRATAATMRPCRGRTGGGGWRRRHALVVSEEEKTGGVGGRGRGGGTQMVCLYFFRLSPSRRENKGRRRQTTPKRPGGGMWKGRAEETLGSGLSSGAIPSSHKNQHKQLLHSRPIQRAVITFIPSPLLPSLPCILPRTSE